MVDYYSITHPDSYTPGSQTGTYNAAPYDAGRVIVSPESNALAEQIRQAQGLPNTTDTLNNLRRGVAQYNAGGGSPAPSPYPSLGSTGGSGFSYGGGGGGGGGGGPAGMTQEQFDWATSLLGQGQPDPLVANRLDLPAYRSKFHPQMYNQMLRRFNRGVKTDKRTANRSYDQLGNFIRNNYTNAFQNPRARAANINQAPGMNSTQMARMAQNQGVDPSVVNEQMQGASAADRAFQNLWGVLGANETQNQRNRLTGVREQRGDTLNALRIAAMQGRTGIGLQRAGAKDEWRTRVEDQRNAQRQQEALANWQRQNQVGDTNFTTSSEYRNNVISSLLGMLPGLAEGVNLPGDLSDLFGLPENGPQGGGGKKKKPEKRFGGKDSGTGKRVNQRSGGRKK
jgi:hypothetical protein